MPRNKQIFTGRSIKEWSGGELNFRKPRISLEKFVEERVNGGMITSIDSANIPKNALQFARNVKVVFDKTSRRDGSTIFGPNPPNFLPVLKMSFLKRPDGSGHTYRFTPTEIHDLQSGVWNPITHLTPLVGTASDRFNVTTNFDIFAFTNNGANNVQWINSSTDESDDLIDNLSPDLPSSAFRYCTGFYNRIVLACIRDVNEIMLAWTGEYGSQSTTKHGLEDLDPLINETSGFGPLVNSSSDTADFISGLFGLTSVMVILREKSIWLSTKQPSATNPFNSNAAVPGIGCDSPGSAQVTKYGLSWLDRRTRTVYHYTPGSIPEPIGRPIEKTLINNIDDPKLIFGSYDPVEDSYSVSLPSVASNIVSTWTYYFQAQAWTYNEYPTLSSFDVIELLTGFIAIDDLVGTIDDLIGTIDELSPHVEAKQQRIFGYSNGLLSIPDPNVDYDIVPGSLFRTDIVSGTFETPGSDTYVALVLVEYDMRIAGNLELWYAPDGGVVPPTFGNPGSFILGDIFTPTVFNKPQIIVFRKVVHSRRYAFAIRASSGQFSILKYELWVTTAGDSSMIRQVPLISP